MRQECQDYLNANGHKKLTVVYIAIGNPTGSELAYCPEYYEIPIYDLEELQGEVDQDGVWRWDGQGNPRTYHGNNSVTKITIGPDPTVYDQQIEEYEEYPG